MDYCTKGAVLPSLACFQLRQELPLFGEIFLCDGRQIVQLIWITLDVIILHKALIILENHKIFESKLFINCVSKPTSKRQKIVSSSSTSSNSVLKQV